MLSLVTSSPGIQNEVLAQIGIQSGYEFVTKWGSQGEGPGQFDGQNDIVPLEESFAIVPDYGNNRLQRFSNTGSFISAFGSEGQDDGQFTQPEGIDVDIKKEFADSNDVCLLYELPIDTPPGTTFVCAWFQVGDNGKISSLRVIFDPRPYLQLK